MHHPLRAEQKCPGNYLKYSMRFEIFKTENSIDMNTITTANILVDFSLNLAHYKCLWLVTDIRVYIVIHNTLIIH